MGLKEDVIEMKKEVTKVKEDSLAWQMLQNEKQNSKRLFTIILVILSMWFITIGYLVYVLNDIGTIETSEQTVEGVEKIENSNITNGDMYGEDKTDKN